MYNRSNGYDQGKGREPPRGPSADNPNRNGGSPLRDDHWKGGSGGQRKPIKAPRDYEMSSANMTPLGQPSRRSKRVARQNGDYSAEQPPSVCARESTGPLKPVTKKREQDTQIEEGRSKRFKPSAAIETSAQPSASHKHNAQKRTLEADLQEGSHKKSRTSAAVDSSAESPLLSAASGFNTCAGVIKGEFSDQEVDIAAQQAPAKPKLPSAADDQNATINAAESASAHDNHQQVGNANLSNKLTELPPTEANQNAQTSSTEKRQTVDNGLADPVSPPKNPLPTPESPKPYDECIESVQDRSGQPAPAALKSQPKQAQSSNLQGYGNSEQESRALRWSEEGDYDADNPFKTLEALEDYENRQTIVENYSRRSFLAARDMIDKFYKVKLAAAYHEKDGWQTNPRESRQAGNKLQGLVLEFCMPVIRADHKPPDLRGMFWMPGPDGRITMYQKIPGLALYSTKDGKIMACMTTKSGTDVKDLTSLHEYVQVIKYPQEARAPRVDAFAEIHITCDDARDMDWDTKGHYRFIPVVGTYTLPHPSPYRVLGKLRDSRDEAVFKGIVAEGSRRINKAADATFEGRKNDPNWFAEYQNMAQAADEDETAGADETRLLPLESDETELPPGMSRLPPGVRPEAILQYVERSGIPTAELEKILKMDAMWGGDGLGTDPK